MTVYILYSSFPEINQVALQDTIEWVEQGLEALGMQVKKVDLSGKPERLKKIINDAPLVFNRCTNLGGDFQGEADFCRLLEEKGIGFTGCSSSCLDLCLNKAKCKEKMRALGVTTLEWMLLYAPMSVCPPWGFPTFVKPNARDGAIGIDGNAVVTTESSLRDQIERIVRNGLGPAIIEPFLSGPEFKAFLLPDYPLTPAFIFRVEFLPSLGYIHQDMPISFVKFIRAADVPPTFCLEVEKAVLAAGLDSYATVDLRLDGDDRPHVIEINPNPGLHPDAPFVQFLLSERMTEGFFASALRQAIARSRNDGHE